MRFRNLQTRLDYKAFMKIRTLKRDLGTFSWDSEPTYRGTSLKNLDFQSWAAEACNVKKAIHLQISAKLLQSIWKACWYLSILPDGRATIRLRQSHRTDGSCAETKRRRAAEGSRVSAEARSGQGEEGSTQISPHAMSGGTPWARPGGVVSFPASGCLALWWPRVPSERAARPGAATARTPPWRRRTDEQSRSEAGSYENNSIQNRG